MPDAQRAYGSRSFVRISKSCHSFVGEIVPGVWDLDPWYHFTCVSRY